MTENNGFINVIVYNQFSRKKQLLVLENIGPLVKIMIAGLMKGLGYKMRQVFALFFIKLTVEGENV